MSIFRQVWRNGEEAAPDGDGGPGIQGVRYRDELRIWVAAGVLIFGCTKLAPCGVASAGGMEACEGEWDFESRTESRQEPGR